MTRVDVDLSGASDALRSELIFMSGDGDVTRVEGGYRLLMPSNPGFWWGNSLRMDRPPGDGDFDRWMRLFTEEVHAPQPSSKHWAFGWDGSEAAIVTPFIDAGFDFFSTVVLAVDRGGVVEAPHPNADPEPVALHGDDWASLAALLVDTRDVERHTEADHRPFIERRIDGWRALQERGQGEWFGVRRDGRIVSALGVFAEADRGVDRRRIGRFQNVATLDGARRQGLAGTLVEHASRHAFEHLDVDTLFLFADADDVARRVYESCGYRVRSHQMGLDRGP